MKGGLGKGKFSKSLMISMPLCHLLILDTAGRFIHPPEGLLVATRRRAQFLGTEYLETLRVNAVKTR